MPHLVRILSLVFFTASMFETWVLGVPLIFRVATDESINGCLGFDRAPQGSWLRGRVPRLQTPANVGHPRCRLTARFGFRSCGDVGHPPPESVGRTKLTNLATRHRLVIPSLTLLPGHGIKSSRFLLNVLATALGAFRLYFVFLQGKN